MNDSSAHNRSVTDFRVDCSNDRITQTMLAFLARSSLHHQRTAENGRCTLPVQINRPIPKFASHHCTMVLARRSLTDECWVIAGGYRTTSCNFYTRPADRKSTGNKRCVADGVPCCDLQESWLLIIYILLFF